MLLIWLPGVLMGSSQHQLNFTQMPCGDLATSGQQEVTWEREGLCTAPPTVPSLRCSFLLLEQRCCGWTFFTKGLHADKVPVCVYVCFWVCACVRMSNGGTHRGEHWSHFLRRGLKVYLDPPLKRLHLLDKLCRSHSRAQRDLLRSGLISAVTNRSTAYGDHVTCCCHRCVCRVFHCDHYWRRIISLQMTNKHVKTLCCFADVFIFFVKMLTNR